MYTDNRVEISTRVADNKTVLIEDRRAAKIHADLVRSYPYPVYDDKGNRISFAIPK